MSGLLGRPLQVVNAGVELFAAELERQQAEVARVEWRPPADGAEGALERLAPRAGQVADANDRAVAAMQAAEPRVVGIGRAGDLLPGLDERTLLHAGPPIDWAEMCGPLRGAIIGAAVHEGIAADPEEAVRLAERGGLRFGPCHERGAVGPMAGVVSASMPVWVVENGASGNARSAPSTRVWARCSGTAPTTPRCWTGWPGCGTCWPGSWPPCWGGCPSPSTSGP